MSTAIPIPTNTTLYDGGKFVQKGRLSKPLELPHVLLLPLTSWITKTTITATVTSRAKGNTTTTAAAADTDDEVVEVFIEVVDLPGLKAEIYDDDDREPFIIHEKKGTMMFVL
jgi:hypothetical protein